MVTEAEIRYGKWEKVLGLCNVSVMAKMKEPEELGYKADECIYQFAGLNHFHWHKVSDNQGNDLTPEILRKMERGDFGRMKNVFNIAFYQEQLTGMTMIPCSYHRYYYRQEEMLQHGLEDYQTIGTRAEQVKATEHELFELYKDPELIHKQLTKRGGSFYSDAACETITSIYANKMTNIVVSTLNKGAVPDLPPDCVVEVSAFISRTAVLPIAYGPLPPAERGWLQVMKNMELCICEAAVTGDYSLLMQAFFLNPLITSGKTTKRPMDELLVAHKEYLPQFAEKIAELEAEARVKRYYERS